MQFKALADHGCVLWCDGVDGVADRIPEGMDGACCGLFRRALIFEKANSMGLKSGLRKRARARLRELAHLE